MTYSRYLLFIFLLISCFMSSCENRQNNQEQISHEDTISIPQITEERIAIPVDSVGGVYAIPATVNGLKMKFIFDTGASDVSLSLTEAIFMLKNEYLKEEDILGASKSQLANGSIEENTRVVLREIEIEGIKLQNISALVSHNIGAPLLLGQSAIQKLGEVLIKEDSIFVVRKVEQNTTKKEESSPFAKEEQSLFEKIKDCLGFHNYQADIDSLLSKAYDSYEDEDYVLANITLNECVQLCEKERLFKRNWEIYDLKAGLISSTAQSIKEGWNKSIGYHKLAFDNWDKETEGCVVKSKTMVSKYAHGISLGYSIPIIDIEKNKIFKENKDSVVVYVENIEEEFLDVINYLYKTDQYSAYCYSGLYYKKNFSMAESYFCKAIKLRPEDCKAYQYLGRLYLESKNIDKAIETLNSALLYSKTKSELGYSYRLLGNSWKNREYSQYIKFYKLAAKNGDITSINTLKEKGYTW